MAQRLERHLAKALTICPAKALLFSPTRIRLWVFQLLLAILGFVVVFLTTNNNNINHKTYFHLSSAFFSIRKAGNKKLFQINYDFLVRKALTGEGITVCIFYEQNMFLHFTLYEVVKFIVFQVLQAI